MRSHALCCTTAGGLAYQAQLVGLHACLDVVRTNGRTVDRVTLSIPVCTHVGWSFGLQLLCVCAGRRPSRRAGFLLLHIVTLFYVQFISKVLTKCRGRRGMRVHSCYAEPLKVAAA
jgi:hypothetical protein